MSLNVIQGDCVQEMAKLHEKQFHLCVTSPPYQGLRTYNGHNKWDFKPTACLIHRLLVDGGVLCWVVGDSIVRGSETLEPFRQALWFVEHAGFLCHDTMIYQKRNFSHPEKSRYHQVFEYVFILSKGKPRVFNPLIDRKNLTAGCVGNLGVNTFTERDGSKSVRSKKVTREFGMRHNVWLGNTRGQEEMCEKLPHPAMMPKWLARDLILSWSNKGDSVFDPMAGSGTVGEVGVGIGRDCTLIESNPEYIPIIEQRTEEVRLTQQLV